MFKSKKLGYDYFVTELRKKDTNNETKSKRKEKGKPFHLILLIFLSL